MSVFIGYGFKERGQVFTCCPFFVHLIRGKIIACDFLDFNLLFYAFIEIGHAFVFLILALCHQSSNIQLKHISNYPIESQNQLY
jgi:hypothetical protein